MVPTGDHASPLQCDILCVGDLNADLIMADPDRPPTPGQEILVRDCRLTLGGSAAILATAAARLGLRVRLAAKVGDDYLGRFLLDELSRAGVDTSPVVVDPTARSGVTVSITRPADRALITYPGPLATFRADEVPGDALAGVRHLHASSYFLQPALQPGLPGLLRRARARGLTTSLDTGDDPADAWDSGLPAALAATDIFFPNEREAVAISGEPDPERALAKLAATVPTVVVKLGSVGAIAVASGSRLRVGAYPVQPVDTTGAGDTFDAGYLWGYLRGEAPEVSLRRAAAAGAISTTWLGGPSDQLSPASVERLIAGADGAVRVEALVAAPMALW